MWCSFPRLCVFNLGQLSTFRKWPQTSKAATWRLGGQKIACLWMQIFKWTDRIDKRGQRRCLLETSVEQPSGLVSISSKDPKRQRDSSNENMYIFSSNIIEYMVLHSLYLYLWRLVCHGDERLLRKCIKLVARHMLRRLWPNVHERLTVVKLRLNAF